MIGLCYSCKSSGTEITLVEDRPICKRCIRLGKIAEESNKMFEDGTQGDMIDI